MHPHATPASGAPSHHELSPSATSAGTAPLPVGDVSPIGEDGPVTAGSPDPDLEWWTTSDVAEYLGVRVGTVSAYRKSGRLPEPDQTVGRTHMWRPGRIVEWHASRTRVGVGGRPRNEVVAEPAGHTVDETPVESAPEPSDSGTIIVASEGGASVSGIS
ncbi:helix-turn-helix domain-containing protein [Frankia sp. EUN1f]|uniref:helix-turn-helix domain-containing protein n=1 Tax=Parafrankia sp. EUN1f TaxID=102897 RepID=UPI0012F775A1